jgi:hypothetical protein
LIHAGEFGTYREHVLREFLRLCVPARLDIGTGFLINHSGEVSSQLDVVIYDRAAIPRIESTEHQRFFPVEGVCAIGEVKSRLSKTALRDALNKLARAKSKADVLSTTIPLRRDPVLTPYDFSRKDVFYDQLISFLVCEKFDFDSSTLSTEVAGWYDKGTVNHHKHNFVLSIDDGLLLYVNNGKSWTYPSTWACPVKGRFMKADKDSSLHFHRFCSQIFAATSSATILFPEITSYMPDLRDASNIDET